MKIFIISALLCSLQTSFAMNSNNNRSEYDPLSQEFEFKKTNKEGIFRGFRHKKRSYYTKLNPKKTALLYYVATTPTLNGNVKDQ